MTGHCTSSQFVTRGPINSKLENDFETSCFTTPSVIDSDATGTGFGMAAREQLLAPARRTLMSLFEDIEMQAARRLEQLGVPYRIL